MSNQVFSKRSASLTNGAYRSTHASTTKKEQQNAGPSVRCVCAIFMYIDVERWRRL